MYGVHSVGKCEVLDVASGGANGYRSYVKSCCRLNALFNVYVWSHVLENYFVLPNFLTSEVSACSC